MAPTRKTATATTASAAKRGRTRRTTRPTSSAKPAASPISALLGGLPQPTGAQLGSGWWGGMGSIWLLQALQQQCNFYLGVAFQLAQACESLYADHQQLMQVIGTGVAQARPKASPATANIIGTATRGRRRTVTAAAAPGPSFVTA